MVARSASIPAALATMLAACAVVRPASPEPVPVFALDDPAPRPPSPELCRVSPRSLRRVAGIAVGRTTLSQAEEMLGARGVTEAGGLRSCFRTVGGDRTVLFLEARAPQLGVSTLSLAWPPIRDAIQCPASTALPPLLATDGGLRPGLTRDQVEAMLGRLSPTEDGSFGKSCCGLDPRTGAHGSELYVYSCTAVLGRFDRGLLRAVAVGVWEAPPR